MSYGPLVSINVIWRWMGTLSQLKAEFSYRARTIHLVLGQNLSYPSTGSNIFPEVSRNNWAGFVMQ